MTVADVVREVEIGVEALEGFSIDGLIVEPAGPGTAAGDLA